MLARDLVTALIDDAKFVRLVAARLNDRGRRLGPRIAHHIFGTVDVRALTRNLGTALEPDNSEHPRCLLICPRLSQDRLQKPPIRARPRAPSRGTETASRAPAGRGRSRIAPAVGNGWDRPSG